jgi:predicted Zn-dependent protease with MMP-like domain
VDVIQKFHFYYGVQDEAGYTSATGRLARASLQRYLVLMKTSWPHLAKIAEKEAERTIAALPEPVRERLEGIPVTCLPEPTRDIMNDGVESDTLGLFLGDSYPDETSGGDPLPPQIVLFINNLWDMAESDEGRFREEVRTTLLHEIGHYFGFDENDLEVRGLE